MDSRLILFFIVIIAYFLFGNKNRKGYVIFVCAVLCLEASLRHVSVGVDTYSYFLEFNETQRMSWSAIAEAFRDAYIEVNATTRDPGYFIIEKIFHIFSDSWQFFLFTISALYFYSVGRFIYQNTEKPIHALFAFVLYIALFHIIILCVFRQAICMSIFFLATPLLQKKKWIPYIVIVLLASTIHRSMLLALLMVPLVMISMKNKRRLLAIAFVAVPVVVSSARSIITIMATAMENEYYMTYAETEGQGGAIFYFIMCAAVALYIFINIKQFDTWDKSIYVAGIILLVSLAPLIIIHGALIRISQYFAFYMMFAIPVAFDSSKKYSQILYLIVIAVLMFLTFRTEFTYHFFWENIPV